MSWKEEYERKLIDAEAAANLVKSGDWVVFPVGRAPVAFGFALAARKEELQGVRMVNYVPAYDFGWYDEGWEDSFTVYSRGPTPITQQMFDEHRLEILVDGLDLSYANEELPIPDAPDVVGVQISTPDEQGFCSFGSSVWDKQQWVKKAKLAIGEVNPRLIRTYGHNAIHVSEFDYFVEHVSLGGEPGALGSLAGRALKKPEPYFQDIARYVNELIDDGDTLQTGVSRTIEPLINLGMLDGKHDLGWHSEATIPGAIRLVREGLINGKRKTVNPGIFVTTAVGGDTREEIAWVNQNPLFWLMESGYVWDARVIGDHDHFTAINAAAMIDLSGQMTAERIGYRILAAPGGQLPFVIGAWLSRGGKVIHVCPSTVQTPAGLQSRIVVEMPPGTLVTQHRQAMQYVVTEYGIAKLKGKTVRQRAEELIAVAHPDFRPELRAAAKRLFWP